MKDGDKVRWIHGESEYTYKKDLSKGFHDILSPDGVPYAARVESLTLIKNNDTI